MFLRWSSFSFFVDTFLMHWWPHAIDFMSQSRSSLCCSFDFFKGNRAKRWKSGKTSKYHELGMFCTDFFTTFDLPPTDQFMHSSFLKLCRNGENTLLEIWCASFDLSTFKRQKTIFFYLRFPCTKFEIQATIYWQEN